MTSNKTKERRAIVNQIYNKKITEGKKMILKKILNYYLNTKKLKEDDRPTATKYIYKPTTKTKTKK